MPIADVVAQRRMRVFRQLWFVPTVFQRIKRHLAHRPQRLARQIVPPNVEPAPVRVKIIAHVKSVFVPQLDDPRHQQPRHGRVPLLVHLRIENPSRFQVFANRNIVAHVRIYLEALLVFAHVLRVFVQLAKRLRDDLAQRHGLFLLKIRRSYAAGCKAVQAYQSFRPS